MADRPGTDPYATIVDAPPASRPTPWWMRPWSTLAGRIYTLVVVAALLFAAFAVVYERRELELERSLELLRAELWVRELVAAELGAFRRASVQIDTLAGRLEAGAITPEGCVAATARRTATDPLIVSMAVFDGAGTAICHSDGPDAGLNVATQPWFGRAVATEGAVVSEAFASPRHGVQVMVVARRVDEASVTRVLAAAIDVDALAARLAAAGMPDGSRLTIVDPSGRVAFDAPGGERVGTLFAPEASGLSSSGRATIATIRDEDDEGASLVLAAVPVLAEDDGTTLVLAVPTNALFSDVRPNVGRAAALTIAVLGGLFAVASLALSRLVFRPIRVLEQAMQRVADGDLTSRVAPAARRGELRTLAAAFDGMTRALRHQRRALAQAADALAEREQELRLLAANLVDLVYATDAQGRITYASPSYREGLGYDPERLIGRDPLSLVHPDDVAAVATLLGAEFREGDGHVRTEARLRAADGTHRWFELIVRPRRGPDGRHLGTQGTLRDVTERKRLEALLADQALNDPLTGLPNRRSFDAIVQRLLSQAKRTGELVAVGFVDLDDFKAVNDTHGHQAGDVLLQEVADRLRAAVREGDVVARLGGDEFTLALRELQDEHHARTVAERIAASFAAPFDLGLTTVEARASIGVALFPAHGDDPEALLRAADRAMYHAKRARAGSVAFAAVGDGDEPGR